MYIYIELQAEPVGDVKAFLTDSERMKDFVPEEQLDDFNKRVEEFFNFDNIVSHKFKSSISYVY